MNVDFPAFGEQNVKVVNVNKKADIYKLFETDVRSFSAYCTELEKAGYELKEYRDNEVYRYAAYFMNGEGVFANYFVGSNELYIVTEKDCNYFEFTDKPREKCVAPQVTQLTQEDFGMSYAIRLSDGRFIVIDGGNNFEPDIDRLMNCLKAGSPFQKPVIAAWIMTHEHADHYLAYIGFDDKYGGEYEVQSFILNFMEIDDERFPGADATDWRQKINTSREVNVPIMFSKMEASGASIYMAHTGQVYNIGDARLEFLSSLDETVDFMRANINATSLVFRMELGGQTILWTGDATFSEARLPQRYGAYIKSDILQVPHHGFEGPIDPDVELLGYKLNAADAAFIPVSEINAYTTIDTYRVGPRYLYEHSDITEIITGEKNRTLTLPYTPEKYRRNEFKAKFREGLSRAGATTWVFSGLNIKNTEDITFNFLNTTNKKANVWVSIYFLDGTKNVGDIKIELGGGFKKIDVTSKEDTITDSVWFSWMTPDLKGFPSEGEFMIRFISDIPVIISNDGKQPVYYR
ncbi:MAG: hypothetical protein IKK13_02285 [Clostridia bacterium]|nr:hypothetical protein [Clostridia bacterium]